MDFKKKLQLARIIKAHFSELKSDTLKDCIRYLHSNYKYGRCIDNPMQKSVKIFAESGVARICLHNKAEMRVINLKLNRSNRIVDFSTHEIAF